MEEFHDSQEKVQELLLNRKEIAVNLRRLDIDVDFEDWDGLEDDEVLGAVANLAAMYDLDLENLFTEAGLDVEKVEIVINRKWIAETLQEVGVLSLDEATLDTLSDEALPRMIAWHAKEVGIAGEALEELGYKCLDEKWERDRWI